MPEIHECIPWKIYYGVGQPPRDKANYFKTGENMKILITSALITVATVTSLMAAPLTLTVTELKQKEFEPDVYGADVCYVHGSLTNGSDQELQVIMNFLLSYKEGSFSSMVAPAGLSFGNTDGLSFLKLAAGATANSEESVLGVDCSEITQLTFEPLCKDAGFVEIACPVDVVLSDQSVLPVQLQGDAKTVGTEIEAAPIAPMHGLWHVNDDQGRLLTKLDLTAPMDESITGTFESHSNLCKIMGESAACPIGYGSGDIRYASHADSGKVTITIEPTDDSKITFLWDFETGVGKVVNQRGSLNAPITVQRR